MGEHIRHLSKKEKKKLQQKKNRHHERIYQAMRLRRAEAARVQEMEKGQKPKPGEKKGKEWSDKVSTVRNRLTGKKRDSKERWNRFAGTSDAGGRGL